MDEYKRKTIESYDKNSEFFSRKFKEQMNLDKREEFQKFLELLRGKDILDIGCGSGDHAEYFVKNKLNVTCIDLSKEMIKLCKEKGLNAQIMDIENLEFDNESFDGIWSATSLLHVPKEKMPDIVDKLYEILKSKGILHISLKKGEGEGIVKHKETNSERFFSIWKKQEVLSLFDKKFKLLYFSETEMEGREFIKFFFIKD